ncbi:hypothetical protein GALL_509730 [mine drainage metagenome]|uniref:Uncharacterized protein n=1 Tax=mine drainage metagenome TaxID=410659 RepID=A0A1J5P9M6_9ZZZZ
MYVKFNIIAFNIPVFYTHFMAMAQGICKVIGNFNCFFYGKNRFVRRFKQLFKIRSFNKLHLNKWE